MSNTHKAPYDLRTTEGRKQQAVEAALEAVSPIKDQLDALMALMQQNGGVAVGKTNTPEIAPERSNPEVVPTYKTVKAKKKANPAQVAGVLHKAEDVVPIQYHFDGSGRLHIILDPRANGMATTQSGKPAICSGKGVTSIPLPWDESKALWLVNIKAGIGENRGR